MKKFLLALAGLSVSTGLAFGQVSYDFFDDYSIGAFEGTPSTGSSQGGWLNDDPWYGSVGASPGNTATDIVEISSPDNALLFNGDGVVERVLADPISGSVWVCFEFTIFDATSAAENDFAGLFFNPDPSPLDNTEPSLGFKGDLNSGSDQFFARVELDDSSTVRPGINVVSGQTYTLVGHLYDTVDSASGFDTFDLWVDPTATDLMGSADASSSGTLTFNTVASVGFRVVNLEGEGIEEDQIWFNNLVVAGTKEDLLAQASHVIPEPSTYALIFGGLVLGVVLFRRKLGSREVEAV